MRTLIATIFCLLVVSLSGAQNNDVYIHPGQITVAVGENVTLQVVIQIPVSSFEFTMLYDDALELIETKPGSDWPYLWADNGYIAGAVYDGTPATASGIVALLTFRATVQGVYEIRLESVFMTDINGMDITPDSIGACNITVTSTLVTGQPTLVRRTL